MRSISDTVLTGGGGHRETGAAVAVSRSEPQGRVDRLVGRTLFASRWILAPFYLGLGVSLLALLALFAKKTVGLVAVALDSDPTELITQVLSLVDVSLVASLVLMVMLSSYENFISSFELGDKRYLPSWMGRIDFGDLKLKLLTSIVAITAIHLLETFLDIDHATNRYLAWSVGIMMAFVLAGVFMALTNRMSGGDHS